MKLALKYSCSVWLLLFCSGLSLTSCTFLPSNGPSLSRVKSSSNTARSDGKYVLIPVEEKVLTVMNREPHSTLEWGAAPNMTRDLAAQGFPELLGAGRSSSGVVAGDILNVTIFDQAGGLFSSPIMPNGLSLTGAIPHDLPPQIVDASGEIMIPFAGRIPVRGRTLSQIQDDIQTKLKEKTVNPQVLLTISSRKGGDAVSVLGDVKSPSQIPISMGGTRLLDAIALVGGSTGKEYESIVSVIREGVAHSALLSEIYSTPSKNIPLQFGDTVLVRVREKKYLSFGANGSVSSVSFGVDRLSLADALAKVGGADDNKANPSAILLYRQEPRDLVLKMGLTPVDASAATCPVIYRLDLTKADGFFLAKNFEMRDQDMIYTTSSGSVGLMKFFGLIGGIFAPASQAGGAAATAVAAGVR